MTTSRNSIRIYKINQFKSRRKLIWINSIKNRWILRIGTSYQKLKEKGKKKMELKNNKLYLFKRRFQVICSMKICPDKMELLFTMNTNFIRNFLAMIILKKLSSVSLYRFTIVRKITTLWKKGPRLGRRPRREFKSKYIVSLVCQRKKTRKISKKEKFKTRMRFKNSMRSWRVKSQLRLKRL